MRPTPWGKIKHRVSLVKPLPSTVFIHWWLGGMINGAVWSTIISNSHVGDVGGACRSSRSHIRIHSFLTSKSKGTPRAGWWSSTIWNFCPSHHTWHNDAWGLLYAINFKRRKGKNRLKAFCLVICPFAQERLWTSKSRLSSQTGSWDPFETFFLGQVNGVQTEEQEVWNETCTFLWRGFVWLN